MLIIPLSIFHNIAKWKELLYKDERIIMQSVSNLGFIKQLEVAWLEL